MPTAGRQQWLLRELLPGGIYFIGMAQELLHEMQEKFPIFILIAAGLLDLSGASRNERGVSGMWGLSSAGAAQPRARSSPVPVTENHWDEVTWDFQSPGADPSNGTASDSTPQPGRAANRTALLPGDEPGTPAGAELLHTEPLKPRDGHTSPGNPWSGSTQGPQATTPLGLQLQAGNAPGAAASAPSPGLPQPRPSAGTPRDSPQLSAPSSPPVSKQSEVPSPKTSPLTSVIHFHPPRRETAAPPFPTRARISLGSAGEGWSPTGISPTGSKGTNPPGQPGPRAGVTPAHPRNTQSVDAGGTTSAIPPQPAPGDLGSLYFRTTRARAVPLSPAPSLEQEQTGSKGRNSTSAVTRGSGRPAQLPAPHTLPPGSVNSSLLMEAPAPAELLPSPFPAGTTGQEPLSLHRALSCTKHVPPDTNRSSQEVSVLALQREAAPGVVTGKPGKSPSPESPQPSLGPSSLSQLWISTLKPSPTTKELKAAISPPPAGMSTLGNADLQPWDSVHAGLQPPGASAPARAGLQPMGLPTPAGKGLHTPTSSTPPGSRLQGVSARPVSQEALAGMLQVSPGEDSRRSRTVSPALTPPASPVPSPSGALGHRDQAVPSPSSVPPSPTTLRVSTSIPSILLSTHAQGSHSSSTTAHPGPGVPRELPAPLAQALGRGDPLTLLPSSPYLSFVFQSSNGTICLRPTQGSPLPTTFPNASVGGLVSVQQILPASNSSGLDLANFQPPSPSSLVLVKPVFVLLPGARAGSQALPSPQGDHGMATSAGTARSSQDIPVQTSPSYPSGKAVGSVTTLSTVSKQQAEGTKGTSQPANADQTTPRGLSPALTSAPGRVLDPRTSPTVQTMLRLPEEMQIPAPHPQQTKDTNSLSLPAEPVPSSPVSPLSTQSPRASPEVFVTTEKPHSASVAPFLPPKGLQGSPEPAQPGTSTGAAGQVQHGERSSATTPSPAHGPCTGRSTSEHPPKVFPSTRPLQATSQGLPGTKLLPSPVVPSTSSASPVLPAGNEHSGPGVGSTARSGGVPVPATAAQTTPTTAGKPALTRRLEVEFTPIVPEPFKTTRRPTTAAVQTPFSTEVQRKTAASGKALAVVTPPGTSASPPAPSAAPAELSPQASTRENTKPTKTSTSAGTTGAGKFLGTSVPPSALLNTRTQQAPSAALGNKLVVTPVQPSVSTGSVPALQRQPQSPQSTARAAPAATPLPAAAGDGLTASLQSKELLLTPSALQSDPHVALSTSAVSSAPPGKGQGEARGDAAPTRQLPTEAPASASPQASPRPPLEEASHPLEEASHPLEEASHSREEVPHPLEEIFHPWEEMFHPVEELSHPLEEKDAVEHTGPSSPSPAAGPPTAPAASVSADRLVNGVTPQPPLNDSELLLARHLIQLPPAPQSPSYPPGPPGALTPPGDPWLDAAGTDSSQGLLPSTEEAEEEGRTREVTEEAARGWGTVVTLEPGALGSDAPHRRGLHSEVSELDGLAVVSDPCGSGNHSVRLSLSPAGDTAPGIPGSEPSRDTFLAVLALQSNSSRALLQLHSCCVTPSASPVAPGAQCCLFRRLPFECRQIQVLQSSGSRGASFTIQLFQMLNHSLAYLHCELSVCLPGTPGCEQDCLESVEPLPQPSDRNSHGNLRSLISLGPVWRTNNRFLYKPVEGAGPALLLPVLLGSLTGLAVLGSAFMGLWLHHRHKAKPARDPPFGAFHGL